MLLINLISIFSFGQADHYIFKPNEGIEKAKNASDSLKIYNNNINYYTSSNLGKAIEWYNKAKALFSRANNKTLEATTYEYIADAYWFNNQFELANDNYFKCNKIGEELNNKSIIAKSLYNIGWIKCFQLKDKKNIDLFYKALHVFRELKDTSYIIQMYDALGNFYKSFASEFVHSYDSCEHYFIECIKLIESTDNKTNKAASYVNTGGFYAVNSEFNKAKKYLYKAISDIQKSENFDVYNYTSAYTMLIYTLHEKDSLKRINDINDTLSHYWSNPITEQSRSVAYEALSSIYEKHKLYEKSLKYARLFKELDDSIKTKSFNQSILNKENQYVIEKKDKALKELSLQNQITSSKNRLNKFIIYGLVLFALVILIGLYFLFKSNKNKQKSNELLEEKNKIISEKKLEIDQSIKYAKGIQSALLPTPEEINKVIEKCFIYYLPKDVVSGDFYWFQQLSDDEILLACADCTGHGVPGSLMSIVSIDKLNLSLFENKLTNPNDILFNINNQIKSAIKQQKDGLDIALIKYNLKTKTIYYSGANRNLWVVRNSVLLEYKATKNCIAGHTPLNTVYNQEEIKLEPNDFIVLSTDGYADQFGGGKGDGKKMMTKRFKEVVIAASKLPINDAENLISNNYKNWMGKFEQIDDVCVIGFRV